MKARASKPALRRPRVACLGPALLATGCLSAWRAPSCYTRTASQAASLSPQITRRCSLRAFSNDATSTAADEISTWSVRELREFLDDRGVRHSDCFEKQELIQRARSAREQQFASKRASGSSDTAQSSSSSQFRSFGEVVTIPCTQPPERGVLFFLHGFGDSARGFVSQLPNLLQMPSLRYVLPTAPSQGFGMRSWFSGMPSAMSGTESLQYVHHLVREELARGTQGKQIFLGGFSQGGSIAVKAALSFPEASLGGCIAASTFLELGSVSSTQLIIAPVNKRLPVLCCHGEADSTVPLASGQALVAKLRSQSIPTEFRSYPGMGHAYCPEEAGDVARFLQQRILLAGGADGLRTLRAAELKRLLVDAGVSTAGCFEKSELLERACQVLL